LPFKCDLQRYNEEQHQGENQSSESKTGGGPVVTQQVKKSAKKAWVLAERGVYQIMHTLSKAYVEVGLCRLNQVDPCPITYNLSNPQPNTYQVKKPVSKFAFQMQLAALRRGAAANLPGVWPQV
jgi:hypothetical protein